jgi:putative hemolysin
LVNPIVYLFLGAATFISFWSSLVEATYLTVRPHSLSSASNRQEGHAREALHIANEKTRLISTTTFLDTISNVVLATTMGLILSDAFGPIGWVYSAVIGSLVIMIILYLLPKAIGVENSVRMALTLAPSSYAVLRVLSPIALPLTSLARSLSRRIVGAPTLKEQDLVNEFEDFLLMLEKAGHIESGAGKILRTALTSSKSTARDALTPVKEIVAVNEAASVLDTLKIMGRSNHPHLPISDKAEVYVGAVTFRSLSKALAAGNLTDSVLNYMVQPAKVNSSDPVATVMDKMEKLGVTMAFVMDEGRIVGMITLTDILEVVLGMKV